MSELVLLDAVLNSCVRGWLYLKQIKESIQKKGVWGHKGNISGRRRKMLGMQIPAWKNLLTLAEAVGLLFPFIGGHNLDAVMSHNSSNLIAQSSPHDSKAP